MLRTFSVFWFCFVLTMIYTSTGCINELDEADGFFFESSKPPKAVTKPGGTPEERIQGIVEAHNAVRAEVTETEEPLPDLLWSDELASVAQGYANELADMGCRMVHSQNSFGENLAWYAGMFATPDDVVQGWASELDCYTFGTFLKGDSCTRACDRSSGCGHYTQLVWRNTSLVGCGVADCDEGFTHQEIWVCNYDPPGNYIGQKPY